MSYWGRSVAWTNESWEQLSLALGAECFYKMCPTGVRMAFIKTAAAKLLAAPYLWGCSLAWLQNSLVFVSWLLSNYDRRFGAAWPGFKKSFARKNLKILAAPNLFDYS